MAVTNNMQKSQNSVSMPDDLAAAIGFSTKTVAG